MRTTPLSPEAAELIARRFHALSDPTRLRIIDLLRRQEEASVGEIATAVQGSQQNVSKHLSALLAEGFVSRSKRGTSSIYRIADPGVHQICDGISSGIEVAAGGDRGGALRARAPGASAPDARLLAPASPPRSRCSRRRLSASPGRQRLTRPATRVTRKIWPIIISRPAIICPGWPPGTRLPYPVVVSVV